MNSLPCSRSDCDNKTDYGHCKSTACIKPMNLAVGYVSDVAIPEVAPVVHGRWVMTEYRTEENRWLGWHCSNCGDTYDGLGKLDERKHKYCHHCGAIMDGKKKEVKDND